MNSCDTDLCTGKNETRVIEDLNCFNVWHIICKQTTLLLFCVSWGFGDFPEGFFSLNSAQTWRKYIPRKLYCTSKCVGYFIYIQVLSILRILNSNTQHKLFTSNFMQKLQDIVRNSAQHNVRNSAEITADAVQTAPSRFWLVRNFAVRRKSDQFMLQYKLKYCVKIQF